MKKFYEVIYSKKSEKFLNKNKIYGIKFYKAFTEISTDINNLKKYDVKKYMDKEFFDIFRLRIGSYRAIFRVVNSEIIIYVINIDSKRKCI